MGFSGILVQWEPIRCLNKHSCSSTQIVQQLFYNRPWVQHHHQWEGMFSPWEFKFDHRENSGPVPPTAGAWEQWESGAQWLSQPCHGRAWVRAHSHGQGQPPPSFLSHQVMA